MSNAAQIPLPPVDPAGLEATTEAMRQAAETLFNTPKAKLNVEPATPAEAAVAVTRLRELLASAPGVFAEALDGARAGAEVLSSDRLQGLAEIVQNADDAGATWIRFCLLSDGIRVEHNGRPLVLKDVLALAVPWLTTKTTEALATGRFGIGLMTLHALSPSLEVHSGPYHIGLGEPNLSWLEAEMIKPPTTTVMHVPLQSGVLSAQEFREWFQEWDDAALLFCSSVSQIEVLVDQTTELRLTLNWSESESVEATLGGAVSVVQRRTAIAQDGRRWNVHTAEAAKPHGVKRKRKAHGKTVPLGVALPISHDDKGVVYAGLPIDGVDVSVRLHTQFDPTTSRRGIASTHWNDALYPLLADLWEFCVLTIFSDAPSEAWRVIPLPTQDDSRSTPLQQLLLKRSRKALPTRVTIQANGDEVALTDLAVESATLTGVISEAEIAELADLPATLPFAARDIDNRWRDVLDDWREAGADIPEPVSVADALVLLKDQRREPERVIPLVAAAIDDGLEPRLASLPSVVLADESRVAPPQKTDTWLLTDRSEGFAHELGVAKVLHSAHLADGDHARRVLEWLKRIGAIPTALDDISVLRRIADAGLAGKCVSHGLGDEQLINLRNSFERMPADLYRQLGHGIGRAILVRGYEFDKRGKRIDVNVSPAKAYIPQSIEKERNSFSAAAGTAPGIVWVAGRYGEVLKSQLGRAGIGPAKFFRLLGAETTPRLLPHPSMDWRYSGDQRKGLSAWLDGASLARREAITRLGATYTLDDKYSPDLVAALVSIANERKAKQRRDRAAAMLSTLGRAWDRLEEHAEAVAADDYRYWQVKGKVRAYWVWEAGSIAWLDDAKGKPQPPVNLRRRTPGTVAVHGADAPGYLHRDLHEHRIDVLTLIGVAGDPDMGSLVGRLRDLRESEATSETIETEAATVYRTLSDRISDGTHLPGDLSSGSLIAQFSSGAGLILTRAGWKRPTEVLNGDPIFGHRRAFVPVARYAARLWSVLKVRHPGVSDAVSVLGELGRRRKAPPTDDLAIMLESLRLMAAKSNDATLMKPVLRQLASLPLWTSKGWMTKRPVFVTDNLPLADGLEKLVPLWTPGGEVSQFRQLFSALRLTQVDTESARVVDAESALADRDATEMFRSALRLLKDDLVRNEPAAVGALGVTWDQLLSLEVRTLPQLSVSIANVRVVSDEAIPVRACVDLPAAVLYLRDAESLTRVDGGGRAIAGLFAADRRRIAQAWLAASEEARRGKEVAELKLAAERAEAAQKAVADRLAAFQNQTAAAHKKSAPSKLAAEKPVAASPQTMQPQVPASSQDVAPRKLIDPAVFRVSDPSGKIEVAKPTPAKLSSQSALARALPTPSTSPVAPKSVSPLAAYSDLEKEAIGLALLRKVLATDADDVRDFRAQRGLGADAVGLDNTFYELKVHAGAEPNEITLEGSQIQRALDTNDFFLVIVSNVEGEVPRPKVRIIVNPLAQLKVAERDSVPLAGVHSAHSIVYEFDRIEPS